MRGLRDEYNGFRIGCLDLLPPLQLHSITTAHNRWLSKIRSISHWTTSDFASTDWLGCDLRIGHFFSFRCPLVNTPQLNFWILLQMSRSSLRGSLYSLPHIHGKCLLLVHIHGNCLLIPLTWKARTVPSRSPRIRISRERELASRFLAMH
jgi:hypothetical protein